MIHFVQTCANAYEHDVSRACAHGCALPAHVYVGDYVSLPVSEHGRGHGVHHHAYGRVHALVPHAHACVHAVLRYAARHPPPTPSPMWMAIYTTM